jgi:hypothetical protein
MRAQLALLPALLIWYLAGCARPAGRAEPRARAPAAADQRPRAPASDDRKAPPAAEGIPDPVARRVEASVESLGTGQGGGAVEQLASALRSLAAAVEILPGATWARVQRIRDAARELDSESASDTGKMQRVVDGLGALARVLVELDPPARAAEFQEAVTSLGPGSTAGRPAAPRVRRRSTCGRRGLSGRRP